MPITQIRRNEPPDFCSQEIAMNSIHRMGVTVATVATFATVAGALVAQGYVAARQATVQAPATIAAPAATPTLGPEIVYVNPVPAPQVIHVTQTQPPAAPPPVVHVVVPTVGGDDNQGSDD
jgi:hypothetical protein